MSTYLFYTLAQSGKVATLERWRSDYESMNAEVWSGKPAEQCHPDNWIEDGQLEALELTTDGNYFLTCRRFKGWYGDVSIGDPYVSEWACYAKHKDASEYQITWRFEAIKGSEPEIDEWPWDEESTIFSIKRL